MKIRILIVENENIISQDLRLRLENAGYIVTDVACSPEEAIQKIQLVWPDVVVWDPTFQNEVNAFDLARKISCNFQIPLVYVSSFEVPTGLENYGKVTKPIDDEELFEVLGELMSMKPAAQLSERRVSGL
jgi:chemotaxis response regulator CheB